MKSKETSIIYLIVILLSMIIASFIFFVTYTVVHDIMDISPSIPDVNTLGSAQYADFGITAIVLAATATGVGGYMQYQAQQQQAKDAKAMASYEYQRQEQESNAQRLANREMQLERRRKLRSLLSSQRAQTGKQGFQYKGSFMDIAMQSIENSELDIARKSFEYEMGSQRAESAGQMALYKGKLASRTARMNSYASLVSTAGSLATLGMAYNLSTGGSSANTSSSTVSSSNSYDSIGSSNIWDAGTW